MRYYRIAIHLFCRKVEHAYLLPFNFRKFRAEIQFCSWLIFRGFSLSDSYFGYEICYFFYYKHVEIHSRIKYWRIDFYFPSHIESGNYLRKIILESFIHECIRILIGSVSIAEDCFEKYSKCFISFRNRAKILFLMEFSSHWVKYESKGHENSPLKSRNNVIAEWWSQRWLRHESWPGVAERLHW